MCECFFFHFISGRTPTNWLVLYYTLLYSISDLWFPHGECVWWWYVCAVAVSPSFLFLCIISSSNETNVTTATTVYGKWQTPNGRVKAKAVAASATKRHSLFLKSDRINLQPKKRETPCHARVFGCFRFNIRDMKTKRPSNPKSKSLFFFSLFFRFWLAHTQTKKNDFFLLLFE